MAKMSSARIKKLAVRIIVLVLAALMLMGTVYSVIVYTMMSF